MLSSQQVEQLKKVAQTMVAPGKGILAADESLKTVGKRFTAINLENTEDNRRAFREMLLTGKGMGQYISGVILFDETIRQTTSSGKTFVDGLKEEGVLPGIKVDEGLVDMVNSPLEKVTKGLTGLGERLDEYVKLGATFCKWRCVITIGDGLPTDANIRQNAHDLALYALLCQQHGLVPMVEPEVLMEGNHTRAQTQEASRRILAVLFEELQKEGVFLEGLILKTNMVVTGKESGEKETPQDVATATVTVFQEVLPKKVAGVAFLSGGQTEVQATENLNAINQHKVLPFSLTFSFARALQDSATRTWMGKNENIPAAQKAFLHRAKMNSLASVGKYRPEMENT